MVSEEIAKKWLLDTIESVKNKDHAAHMALISRKVSLQGIPGYESINYDEWSAQTKYELEKNILKSVQYEGCKLISSTPSHVMFKSFETVAAYDGTINAQGVEILLEKEADGQWRLVQERVLNLDESKHDGLLQ